MLGTLDAIELLLKHNTIWQTGTRIYSVTFSEATRLLMKLLLHLAVHLIEISNGISHQIKQRRHHRIGMSIRSAIFNQLMGFTHRDISQAVVQDLLLSVCSIQLTHAVGTTCINNPFKRLQLGTTINEL